MATNNRNDVFAQIEYFLIRLLLIALLLIAAYKLLEREIYGASTSAVVTAAVNGYKLNPRPVRSLARV